MRPRLTVRHLAIGAAVLAAANALALTGGLPAAAAAAAQVPADLVPLVAAVGVDATAAGVDMRSGGLTLRTWRTRIAPMFDRVPAMRTDRALVGAAVHGAVLGRTVRLPARLELDGDTTIVARGLVLAGHQLRIDAHGHAVHFYPVGESAAGSGPIVIDVSGRDGVNGQTGFSGIDGADGMDGANGRDANNPGDPQDCYGDDGEDGGPGDAGDSGMDGTLSSPGEPGGSIFFDIPPESTDSYVFKANGGAGGHGGDGGQGGGGGGGGYGGSAGQNGLFPGDQGQSGNFGDSGAAGPEGPSGQDGHIDIH
jgi:hypothetical protein